MKTKLLTLFLATVVCKTQHSGLYMECSNGKCSQVTDREIGWEFDQPDPFYIEREEDGAIRKELAEERLGIVYEVC